MKRFGRVPIRSAWFRAWVSLAAVGLVAATAIWTTPGAPSPTATPGTPSATSGSSEAPSGSASPTAIPSSSADSSTWQPITLDPYVPVADMVAVRSDTAGVEPATAFRLTSRTSTPAAVLASRLEVSPAIALSVARGASDAEAIVRPAAALTPGTSYRFRIRTDTGALAASWAFKAKAPLHVVTSIPRDQATGVPTRTGIEATFDQDDVVGYTGKVTISPAVPFRLELEGRTLALVAQKELAERTVYTVTIAKGIGVRGSDVALENDVVIRFETGARETSAESRIAFRDLFAETSPAETPVVGVSVECNDTGGVIDQEVRVHRLADVDRAIAAARQLLIAPTWAIWSDNGLVRTTGLPVALRITAHLQAACGQTSDRIDFPSPLPAGAYLVVLPRPGRDAQMLLQVARLALYTSVSESRSVAWVNDTVTGGPAEGASVGGVTGPAYGRTDATGLLVWTTPRALSMSSGETAAAPIVVVRKGDAATFAVLGSPGWSGYAPTLADTTSYWLALQTDRSAFRTTDTVRAWGIVRPRAGGVARGVEVRLVSAAATLSEAAPAIARAPAAPDSAGMFAASLPIDGLPLGGYQVALVADGQVVASSWIRVDEIRKPAYRIDVTLDRHVLVAGDTFTATAHAVYFDGTPVPGLELTFEHGPKSTAVTDATGTAKVRLKAYLQGDGTYPTETPVSVTPVRPEEGTISGAAQTRVYPAAVWATVGAELAGGGLSVSGRLQTLDLAALERAFVASDPLVEGGAAIGSATVDLSVVRIVQHQRQTGTSYDWIAKRTVPVYETWTEKSKVHASSPATGADGRFRMSVAVPDPRGQYEVLVTAKDGAGRRTVAATAVDGHAEAAAAGSWPWLSAASTGTDAGCCATYAVGDRISLRVEQPLEPQVPGATRFLFTVAQRGIREAIVRSTPSFDRPFLAADIPSVSIAAVQFTGRGYVLISGHDAPVRLSTQEIKVEVRTDAASYRPGADARLQVRTTGPDGKPTAASVVVQAVDEKLYAIDGASTVDLLPALYASLPDGINWRAATHSARMGADTTTGGDTAGGGPRMDFRDTLLFRRVSTDAAGRASISFRLSGDLTSWRVSVGAVDAKLHAGTGSVQVRVGLPFFAEVTVAPEYLVSDRPVLRLAAYGSSLRAGDDVTFRISAPTLGLAPTTVTAKAFATKTLALPALAAGIHRIEIAATTVGRSPALKDSLIRTVRVVASRYQEQTTVSAPLDAGFRATGGDGLTTYIISDAGRATLASILEPLVWADGARVDQALGAAVARDILVDRFGRAPATLPETRFESSAYQQWGGITLLPYASPDLALTTRVALAAPERFDRSSLADALHQSYGDPNSTMTRERGIVALTGLAALGEPVAGELGLFARQPDLTVRERLYLALAYAEIGDEAAARAIERSVLAKYGRAMGPWVRLDISPSRDEVVEATGLLAVLAAAIGDPIADRAQAYVEANPPKRTLQTLEELAFVRHSLDRLESATAKFAWTVDGTRRVVDLASTGSFTLALTAAQRKNLRLERLSGDIAVTTSWSTPARPGARPADPDVRIARTASPGLTIGQTDMVRVKITVTFAPTATDKCYEITERIPSGLAPLPMPDQNGPSGVDERTTAVFWPNAVAGQIVSFCVAPVKPTVVAVYSARVVSPGTYTWEPATIAASAGTERESLTATSTLTIR